MIVSNKVSTTLIAAATSAGVVAVEAPSALTSADGFVLWMLGVGFSTLLASNIGAFMAALMSEPVRPPQKMWALYIASVLIGAASVAILPHIPGFTWLAKAPPQGVGLVAGFFSRWVITVLIEHGPAKLKAWLNGGK